MSKRDDDILEQRVLDLLALKIGVGRIAKQVKIGINRVVEIRDKAGIKPLANYREPDPEAIAAAVALYLAGASSDEVGSQMGMAGRNVLKHVVAAGHKPRVPGPRMSARKRFEAYKAAHPPDLGYTLACPDGNDLMAYVTWEHAVRESQDKNRDRELTPEWMALADEVEIEEGRTTAAKLALEREPLIASSEVYRHPDYPGGYLAQAWYRESDPDTLYTDPTGKTLLDKTLIVP